MDVAGTGDVVGCGGSRPKTESVVVFYDGDASAHAGGFGNFEPLCGVRSLCRGKNRFGFISEAPFLAGVSVHAVMEEGVKFELLPLDLLLVGYGMHGGRLVVGIVEVLVLQGKSRLGMGVKRQDDEA